MIPLTDEPMLEGFGGKQDQLCKMQAWNDTLHIHKPTGLLKLLLRKYSSVIQKSSSNPLKKLIPEHDGFF